MKNIFIGTILFLAVISQTSFFSNFFPVGLIPDVALLIILIWTAKSDFNAVLKWAIFGGFVMDIASSWPIGINTFSFVLVAFVINSVGKRFFVSQFGWRFFVFVIMIVVATIINYVIVFLLANIVIGTEKPSAVFFDHMNLIFIKNIGLKILYNLMTFIVIYWPLEKIDRIFTYYKKEIIMKK